ncbi:MAG: hypothetical protein K8S24_12475, partial [Candidatus Aegiribacteria sp.]|nr:hypothetical protein [Candidatus Aegiribacteria sp.]
MKKKLLIVLAVIIGILAIGGGFFKIRYDKMVRTFRDEKVEAVNLQVIEDGVYTGSFGEFLVSVTLDVTVSDNRITDIDIIEQNGGP